MGYPTAMTKSYTNAKAKFHNQSIRHMPQLAMWQLLPERDINAKQVIRLSGITQ